MQIRISLEVDLERQGLISVIGCPVPDIRNLHIQIYWHIVSEFLSRIREKCFAGISSEGELRHIKEVPHEEVLIGSFIQSCACCMLQ